MKKKLNIHEHEQIMQNEAARKANTVHFYEQVSRVLSIFYKFSNQASNYNCYLNYQVNEQRAQQRQARVQEAAEKQLGIEKRLELEKAYKGMYHLMVLKMLNWS